MTAPVTQTAVILAAGRGSRLDPGGATDEFSKPLMTVAGHTLLHHVVQACRRAGVRRIVVVTGFRAALVEAEARRLDRGDIVTVFNQAWEKSNGVSLLACRDVVQESFLLMMSDHLFDPSILVDLAALPLQPGSVVLAVDRKIGQVFDLDDATKVRIEDDRIVDISKQLAAYNGIDCGLFACTPAIFDALAGAAAARGDCSLSDGMRALGERGLFLPFDIGARWWQDVDTPEMLAHALDVLGKDPAFAGLSHAAAQRSAR